MPINAAESQEFRCIVFSVEFCEFSYEFSRFTAPFP